MKRGKPLQSRRRKCKACREWFRPRQSNQVVCSIACAKDYGPTLRQKQKKAERAELREKVKTRREYEKDAQDAFNECIRLRDKNLPCISCGRHHQGQWHAGHYRTRGANPELAFEPLNVHKQCAPCNNQKSGNVAEYRINLVDRIGEDNVAWLEGPHPPRKYTREQLKDMAKLFRFWAREMKKQKGGR